MFQGKTVWEGVVEVFELIGHPTTERLYGLTRRTIQQIRAVMLRFCIPIHPIKSAEDAVRAVIIQEFKANAQSEA